MYTHPPGAVRRLSAQKPAAVALVAAMVASVLAASSGCAGPTFEAASGSGGSGASSGANAAGNSGSGGSAGVPVAGSGGVSGRAGSGGSGGGGTSGDAGAATAGASDGCSCAAGQYCRAGACYDCSDLSRLDFEAPELVLDHPLEGLRFPRPGDAPSSLFFTLENAQANELWYAASSSDLPGTSLGTPLTPSRSGLFYFEDTTGLGFDALFDETDAGLRTLRVATFERGTLGAVLDAPAPLGASGADDYSATLAPTTQRAYWMTTRDGAPSLRTGVVGSDTVNDVAVQIPANGAAGHYCAATGADAAPFVNAAGTLLVVSAPPMDADCLPLDGEATDLFVLPLNPATGKPAAPAVPLAAVNVSSGQSSETDGAFSSDLCTLYFASDGGTAKDFDFRLFRAARR
jgi:hypothetical protein